jgi:hypothetical protein
VHLASELADVVTPGNWPSSTDGHTYNSGIRALWIAYLLAAAIVVAFALKRGVVAALWVVGTVLLVQLVIRVVASRTRRTRRPD